ncbi:hypothetical protein DRP05_13690 [Archaeoglobales archaeon]|nr:MAG: hypothetical protein DRP05_13690 [Archaeoglobales archaeon]
MVDAAIQLKEQEGRDYFAAPLVLDHSYRFLDKVGSTFNLFYDEERKAAIADVEFWNFTPMLKEVAERVKRDPENTYFSVRVRGRLKDDNSITDLKLIHIAVVLEPADSNARIIGELNEKEGFDMSKLDEVFDFGVVPEHPWKYGKTDKPWRKPALQDFTSSSWEELSNEEKINITGHYAWAPKNPPDKFTDLKLPHHDPKTHAVSWPGVRAAMAALMGARGGVNIPAGDKRKVYNHLAAHYKEFDKTPPNFEALEEAFELLRDFSDFALNSDNKTESNMEAELQEKIANLEKEKAELEAKVNDLTEKIKEADEKLTLMAEIISIDPQVDRDFLKSLNKEQLEKYKADLERRFTKTTEKSLSGNQTMDPYELALKYYGPAEG